MKIGILTHYCVPNNGALLQMFALKEWLTEAGHDVFIIKYEKNYDFSEEAAKKYRFSLRNMVFLFNFYFVKRSPSLFFHKVAKQRIFKKFSRRNFKFADSFEFFDAVIVGSDEVFSLEAGCNQIMYGHGIKTDRLISYAPSFGQTDISLIEARGCRDIIQSGLRKFTRLSVRDHNSRNVVLQLTSVDPVIVCDPVILYDFSRLQTKAKLPKTKYLLLYSYDKYMNEEDEIAAIKSYAAKKGLIVVSAGTYHKWVDKNITCDPLQWVEFFKAAEEIITDTFHGSILSIVFQKRALFVKREINGNKISSLIEDFGLTDFLFDGLTDEALQRFSATPYDGERIRKLVAEKRHGGSRFLEESLCDDQRQQH